MDDPLSPGLRDFNSPAMSASEPPSRAAGSPLPVGGNGQSAQPPESAAAPRARAVPPPGRALANSSAANPAGSDASAFQWAANALRMAIPFVQRILPLLDGHVATAVSNMMAPHPPQPAPKVDLAPIEDGLAELQTEHRELRGMVVEQNNSLKRVEDQLEMVREATDRNTLEQQEFLEDLKAVGSKVNMFAVVALLLLAASVFLNIVLYLHLRRVLP